jgi:hypothetical protein
MRSPKLIAGIVLLLGAVLAPWPALAQDLTQMLTPAEVACNETQLQALLERLSFTNRTGGSTARPTTLFLTYSNRYGFYEGLVVSNQSPLSASSPAGVTPEEILAFHVNPSVRQFLLNPARLPLEQVSLEREDTSSDFVAASDPNAFLLALDPTLDQTGGDARLQINNFSSPAAGQSCNGFLSTSTKPGRGLSLAGITAVCHTDLSTYDRFIFSLLERVLRVEVIGAGGRDAKVALFRGENPLTYRIDVYPLPTSPVNGTLLGRLSLQLVLATDANGRLTTGQLSALPSCLGGQPSDCSNATVGVRVGLYPPIFGGSEVRTNGGAAVSLTYQPGTNPGPVTVDWRLLLAGTPWNG